MGSYIELVITGSLVLIAIASAWLLNVILRTGEALRVALSELLDLAQQMADFSDRLQIIMTPGHLFRYPFSDHSSSSRPFREELMRHLEQERGWSVRCSSPSSASSDSSSREVEIFPMDDIFQDIFNTPAALPVPADLAVLAEPALTTGGTVLHAGSCSRRCSFPPDRGVQRPTGLDRLKRPQLKRQKSSTSQNADEKALGSPTK